MDTTIFPGPPTFSEFSDCRAKRAALLTSPNPNYGAAARSYYMAKIVKVIELLAESEKSWEDAVRTALEQVRKTLRHLRSIYVESF